MAKDSHIYSTKKNRVFVIITFEILTKRLLTTSLRGVFRNNVDIFNNLTLLCSMVIRIISFRRVWFSSDNFVQN